MKLKLRYDDQIQILELNAEDTRQMWVSLSLQGEDLSDEEKEKMIQDSVDEKYNKPEYNNWHKYNRHIGGYIGQDCDDDGTGDGEEGGDWREPLMKEVANPDIFRQDEIERERQWDYEEQCDLVRRACGKKQNWADAFIAVKLDGMSVNDYAAEIDMKDASGVSHYLARAEKKIKEFLENRQK